MGIRSERGPSLQASQSAIWAFARTVAPGTLSGFVAGAIVGGAGSRIAMRIAGIAAGDALQGAETEAGFFVGEITADGTVSLVILGGFVGALGGLLYLAARRWMADAGRWRGLAFGALILAIYGSAIVERDNPDFHRFGPPLLNIATFASLFVFFGLLVAPLFERIERALPPPSTERSGLGARAAQAFGLLLVLPAVMSIGFVAGEGDAILLLLPYVLVVMPIASLLLARAAGRFDRLSDFRGHRLAMGAALGVLALPVALGLVLDVRAVADIFGAER